MWGLVLYIVSMVCFLRDQSLTLVMFRPKPGVSKGEEKLEDFIYLDGLCCCSVTMLCPTLCDPMDCSMPPSLSFTISQSLLKFHFQCPLSWWCYLTISSSVSPISFAFSLLQHQGLFQWVSYSPQVPKVLELQLQHLSFQWILKVDLL